MRSEQGVICYSSFRKVRTEKNMVGNLEGRRGGRQEDQFPYIFLTWKKETEQRKRKKERKREAKEKMSEKENETKIINMGRE